MEYVYGALVLHAAGKPVSEENLKKVLTAAGVKVDETRVKALTAALEGVNIDEALKAAVAMPTAAPAAAPPAEKKEEKKKEEKKEEEKVSEEEAAAGSDDDLRPSLPDAANPPGGVLRRPSPVGFLPGPLLHLYSPLPSGVPHSRPLGGCFRLRPRQWIRGRHHERLRLTVGPPHLL